MPLETGLASSENLSFRSQGSRQKSFLISFYCCLFISVLFTLSAEQFFHWFIIPVTLCGVLIGTDAVDWVRGHMDPFDPVGLLSLFGLNFFFLSPLLIVAWDYQLFYLEPMADWRPWLGRMALLNLAGLVLYRIARNWTKLRSWRDESRAWKLDNHLFFIVLMFALLLTGALQILVYQQFGGLEGYVSTFEESLSGQQTFANFGALFAVSESFPYLLMLGYVVWARRRGGSVRSWAFILLILFGFLVVRLFFGGLRGSRGNTIYAIFWAMGAIHLWLRPFPRRAIILGLVAGLAFMYIFGFFKAVGSDFSEVFTNPAAFTRLEEETNRTFRVNILSDLSRAEIQAYLLRLLADPYSEYRYRWGATYIGGAFTPMPRALWPSKPETKVEAGSELLYGRFAFSLSGYLRSSRIYGLAGEAMLNFTVIAVPFAFILLGLFVGWVRTRFVLWADSDARRLMLPLLIIMCMLLLGSDSDNISVFLVQQGLVMFLVIWLSTPKRRPMTAP